MILGLKFLFLEHYVLCTFTLTLKRSGALIFVFICDFSKKTF